MPIVVTERPYRPVPIDPPRKRWTRVECDAFEATGLWDQQRLELVEGVLINKGGKLRSHTNTLISVQAWLMRAFGWEFVNLAAPIDVAPQDNLTNEPPPDLIVLTKPSQEFPKDNPQPADLRLVVEISDSTLGFDLKTKAELYARAEISEYWAFDIQARRLIVHRDPQNGVYQSVAVYRSEEAVAPLAAPASEFRVGDAFPG